MYFFSFDLKYTQKIIFYSNQMCNLANLDILYKGSTRGSDLIICHPLWSGPDQTRTSLENFTLYDGPTGPVLFGP